MPNKLHSETFNNLSILSQPTSTAFQFDKSIDFYQDGNLTTISVSNPSGDAWFGGVLAPNGKIYGMPSSGNPTIQILEITKTVPRLMTNWILYPQFNKF